MTFVNESRNDAELTYRAFAYKARSIRWMLGGVLGFTLLAGFAMLIGKFALPEEDAPEDLYLIFCFVSAAVFAGLFFAYKPFVRTIAQRSAQVKECTMRYTFSEDGFELASVLNGSVMGNGRSGYAALTACEEFSDFWILYLDRTAYAVRKSGMIRGSAEELAALLKRQTGRKYRVCRKRRSGGT